MNIRKHLVVAVILLFFSVSVIPSTGTLMMENETLTELIIEGPTHGKVGVSYTYRFYLTDSEGCQLWLYVDWDDGDVTEWLGPYDAEEGAYLSHAWDECGIYTIRAGAKGCNGSDYSAKLEVTITPGNTLYVGGSGPNNYTKIQDAIDNASDGDTVFVYSGWYDVDKWIYINKSIRLIGEDKENTIIYSSGIDIVVSEVYVSGFTIQNGSGITIDSYSSEVANNNIILGNIFKSNESFYGFGGVMIINSNYNTVSNNSFFSCGLMLETFNIDDAANSHHNFVYNNTVNDKPLAYFEDTSDKVIDDAGQVILIGCNNITVENLEIFNTISGVQLLDSINCFIVSNVFSNNYLGGISLLNSSNNTISGNIILNGGFGAMLFVSEYNLISGNSFENNEINILFFNTSCNHISNNNFKYSHYLRKLKSIFSFDSDNKWTGNFWNRPRLPPVLIWGFKTISSPWSMWRSLDVDWRPALRPYDVDGEDSLTEGRNIVYDKRGGGFRLCPIGGLRKPLQLLLSSYSPA